MPCLPGEAGHTVEVAVGRPLFGWRELLSIIIPLVLLLVIARNVDWGTAIATLRCSGSTAPDCRYPRMATGTP